MHIDLEVFHPAQRACHVGNVANSSGKKTRLFTAIQFRKSTLIMTETYTSSACTFIFTTHFKIGFILWLQINS